MNLKLNENKKAIFTSEGKDYLIISAKLTEHHIVVKSEDGKSFATLINEENIKVLKETYPEELL
jgi:hypothetical protein